jgi:hypothetical protein
MSGFIHHPERIEKAIAYVHVAQIKAIKSAFTKRKQHWEKEATPSAGSIPVVTSLPSSASEGELVYFDGLYIYVNGSWVRINQPTVRATAGGVWASSGGVVLLPEPEAVYATKTGGGDVYVAVTNSGRVRSLVFEAQSQPAVDASATFAMNTGMENAKHKLSFGVRSNQPNKTLSFRVYTDNTYDFVVATDGGGYGSHELELVGTPTITVTRRYTQESGLVYPCWTACSFVVT